MLEEEETACHFYNVESCLSFMIDFFQNIKQNEPAVFLVANEAIEHIHAIGRCLEEIKSTKICKIS